MFTPIFVDPDFLYYRIVSTIKYNLNITNTSKDRIKALVTSVITDYNEANLDDFNSTLRYSKLVTLIDDADQSIISNDTYFELYKKVNIDLENTLTYTIEFGQELKDDIPYKSARHLSTDSYTIRSTTFYYGGIALILEDDGEGVVRMTRADGTYNNSIGEIGSINYSSGIVTLKNFNPDSYDGNSFKVYAIPKDRDISSNKKSILTLEASELDINVEEIRV
jgi:hypothetical protein